MLCSLLSGGWLRSLMRDVKRMSPMKTLIATVLVVLCLCGCSPGNDTRSQSPLDRVQPGRDGSFGNYIVHVEKREGSSLEGIRILSTEPDGLTATVTANKGTLSQGVDRSFITIVLHDAHKEKSKQKAVIDELTVNLPVTGL
jgi:hypothetical protein